MSGHIDNMLWWNFSNNWESFDTPDFLWQDEIGTEGTAMNDDGILKIFDDDQTERTLEEIYQHYCNNVLNKDAK